MAVPVIGALVSGLLVSFGVTLGQLVQRLIVGLGVGVITYKALDVLVAHAYSFLLGQMTGLSGQFVLAFQYSGFTDGVQIIFGALTARAAVGAVSKLVYKRAA